MDYNTIIGTCMHSKDNLEDTKIFFLIDGFMYIMFVNHEILYSNIPQTGKFEQNYNYFKNHINVNIRTLS